MTERTVIDDDGMAYLEEPDRSGIDLEALKTQGWMFWPCPHWFSEDMWKELLGMIGDGQYIVTYLVTHSGKYMDGSDHPTLQRGDKHGAFLVSQTAYQNMREAVEYFDSLEVA